MKNKKKSDTSACSQESEDLNLVLKKHRANEIRTYRGIVPCLTESYQHKGGTNVPLIVLDSQKSTNTQSKLIKRTSQPTKTSGVQQRLTQIECERLQGFPDGWTEGCSDTQRYKQMGNAVTVNVIKAIAEKLTIRDKKEEPKS